MLHLPNLVPHDVVFSISEALTITEQEAHQVGGDRCVWAKPMYGSIVRASGVLRMFMMCES